jgi:hypothetical protein
VSATDPAAPAEAAKLDASDSGRTQSSDADDAFGTLAEALGRGSRGWPIPEDLMLGGDCPKVGAEADADIAAQAATGVPLKVGLTLTDLWKPTPEEEYECLTQVTAIHRDSIDATVDCDKPGVRRSLKRRLCRADLDEAHMLVTQSGTVTVDVRRYEEKTQL